MSIINSYEVILFKSQVTRLIVVKNNNFMYLKIKIAAWCRHSNNSCDSSLVQFCWIDNLALGRDFESRPTGSWDHIWGHYFISWQYAYAVLRHKVILILLLVQAFDFLLNWISLKTKKDYKRLSAFESTHLINVRNARLYIWFLKSARV